VPTHASSAHKKNRHRLLACRQRNKAHSRRRGGERNTGRDGGREGAREGEMERRSHPRIKPRYTQSRVCVSAGAGAWDMARAGGIPHRRIETHPSHHTAATAPRPCAAQSYNSALEHARARVCARSVSRNSRERNQIPGRRRWTAEVRARGVALMQFLAAGEARRLGSYQSWSTDQHG
jgi:hypothetical protein